MGPRRILATIVGIVQGAIGVVAVMFACILYFDFLGVQSMLNVPAELLPLGLLILSVFGFFSIISGFFLAREGLGRY